MPARVSVLVANNQNVAVATNLAMHERDQTLPSLQHIVPYVDCALRAYRESMRRAGAAGRSVESVFGDVFFESGYHDSVDSFFER